MFLTIVLKKQKSFSHNGQKRRFSGRNRCNFALFRFLCVVVMCGSLEKSMKNTKKQHQGVQVPTSRRFPIFALSEEKSIFYKSVLRLCSGCSGGHYVAVDMAHGGVCGVTPTTLAVAHKKSPKFFLIFFFRIF